MAVGAGAALSAGASYLGSKKQSDASTKGANTQLSMFNTLNAQQQPFIQGGYGALGKLNTLLGLGNSMPGANIGRPQKSPISDVSGYAPTPTGGMDQRISPVSNGPQGMPQNVRLKQILALRAQNGDTEAARVLGTL